MPGRQRSHNIAAGERDYRAELDGALKLARKRLSRARTLRTLLITFPLPVLAAAVWLVLAKFTLLDLPAGLLFKIGISLSKVFGVIERFSEDMDLSFDRAVAPRPR